MQTKKDEMQKRLLEAAQKEFLEKGFKKASIRNIVKAAKTTIGNFYNYFESKEMIFSSLVDTVYKELIYFIKNHQDVDVANQPIEQLDINFLREYLGNVAAQLVPRLNDDFLLLVECGMDTKYANVKNELIDFIGLHFFEHIESYSPNYKNIEMGRIISSQFIHGVIEIIKKYKDTEKRQVLITEQILYTALGVMGILQGGRND